MHGTTLHLFVIYIVSRAIHAETFRVETRESFLIKISEIQKPARVEEKRRRRYFFLIQSGVYVLGTGRRIKSVR